LWDLFEETAPKVKGAAAGESSAYKPLRVKLHEVIRRATDASSEQLNFNTVMSKMMELLNLYDQLKPDPKTDDEKRAIREVLETLAKILAPIAPFIGEEFHEMIGGRLD